MLLFTRSIQNRRIHRETGQIKWLPEAGRWEKGGVTAQQVQDFLWCDGNVWELGRGNGLTSLQRSSMLLNCIL